MRGNIYKSTNTLPKFNSKTPFERGEGHPKRKLKERLPVPSFFRGKMLNFGGMDQILVDWLILFVKVLLVWSWTGHKFKRKSWLMFERIPYFMAEKHIFLFMGEV